MTCQIFSVGSYSSAAKSSSTLLAGLHVLHFATFLLINVTICRRTSFGHLHIYRSTSLRWIVKDEKQQRNSASDDTWRKSTKLLQFMSKVVLPIWPEEFLLIETKIHRTVKSNSEDCFNFEQRKQEKAKRENEQNLTNITKKMRIWLQRPIV